MEHTLTRLKARNGQGKRVVTELEARSADSKLDFCPDFGWHDGESVPQAWLPETWSSGFIGLCSQRWAAISRILGKLATCSGTFEVCFYRHHFLLVGTKPKCWPFLFTKYGPRAPAG